MNEPTKPKPDSQAGIETIETGMNLLLAMAAFNGRPQMLKVLAAAAGMPPSKAHRYLVSFARTGFVDSDPVTGRYRLGPAAVQIGLSALSGLDAVTLSTEAMVKLNGELDETVVLAVWGSHGPTVVRLEESSRPVTINARTGSILPLLSSASGQVFCAFLAPSIVAGPLKAELAANRKSGDARLITSEEEAKTLLAEVRRRGLGRVSGEMMAGVSALSAPVFDYRGYPATVLTAMGARESFDARWNGKVAETLKREAQRVSRTLGFGGVDAEEGPMRRARKAAVS
jgi:DNA-binding IclR family transcriptional regulator